MTFSASALFACNLCAEATARAMQGICVALHIISPWALVRPLKVNWGGITSQTIWKAVIPCCHFAGIMKPREIYHAKHHRTRHAAYTSAVLTPVLQELQVWDLRREFCTLHRHLAETLGPQSFKQEMDKFEMVVIITKASRQARQSCFRERSEYRGCGGGSRKNHRRLVIRVPFLQFLEGHVPLGNFVTVGSDFPGFDSPQVP